MTKEEKIERICPKKKRRGRGKGSQGERDFARIIQKWSGDKTVWRQKGQQAAFDVILWGVLHFEVKRDESFDEGQFVTRTGPWLKWYRKSEGIAPPGMPWLLCMRRNQGEWWAVPGDVMRTILKEHHIMPHVRLIGVVETLRWVKRRKGLDDEVTQETVNYSTLDIFRLDDVLTLDPRLFEQDR